MLRMARKLITNFNRYLFYLATVPLFLAIILTIIDVTGRYFRHPLQGTVDMNALSLVLISTFCWAHIQNIKGHISIDLVYKYMPPRVQTIANLVTSIMALTIFGLIAGRTIPFTLSSKHFFERTYDLEILIWPFKGAIVLGAFFLCLQLTLNVIDCFKRLRGLSNGDTA